MPNELVSSSFEFSREDFKLDDLSKAAVAAIKKLSPDAVIRSATSPQFWASVAHTLPALVLQLVQVDVADVLTGTWKVHEKLKKYGKAPLSEDQKGATMPLASHHVKVTLSPHLALEVDQQPQGRINFEFELDIAINGGVLEIKRGRIMRLNAASIKATGTLKCEGVMVTERSSREYQWPEGLSFGEGIVIAQ